MIYKEPIVIRRDIKYLRIEIKNGEVFLIIPSKLKINFQTIIEKKENWIKSKLEKYKRIEEISKFLEIKENLDYKNDVFNLVEKFSNLLKVKPNSISFRKMKRTWGKCDSKNNICFNKNIKYLPINLVEYIVYHEMCHLLIKNHKKIFWLMIKKLFPNFLYYEETLSAYKIKIQTKDNL